MNVKTRYIKTLLVPVLAVLVLVGRAGPVSATYPGDNGRVVFVRGCCSMWAIHSVNEVGADQVTLTDTGALQATGSPSWSLDGRIVFNSTGAVHGGAADLWIMNGDGSDIARLTQTSGSELEPAWSPNGKRIAFIRRGDVFTMKATGGGRLRLTQTVREETQPDWSPDGTRIAFVRTLRDGTTELFSIGRRGHHLVRLTTSKWSEFDPEWLPDGSGLTFTYLRKVGREDWDASIRFLDTATLQRSPLLNDPSIGEYHAVVSPDGTRMAWVRRSPHPDPVLEDLWELVVSDLDGRNATVADSCALNCSIWDLDWQAIADGT